MSGHMSGNTAEQATEVDWVASPERQELGEALRRLLDAVVQTGAGPADLTAAAAAVNDLTARLAGPVIRRDFSTAASSYRSHMSLVGGLSHPIAPELNLVTDENGGTGEVVAWHDFYPEFAGRGCRIAINVQWGAFRVKDDQRGRLKIQYFFGPCVDGGVSHFISAQHLPCSR